MKILVTGGTGFVGSHIVNGLLEDKHDVVVLKRTYSNTYRIAKYLDKITSYDIDKYVISEIFDRESIDVVIHAATSYGNNESLSDQIESNILFPVKLLEGAVEHKVQAFINTDTFFNKETNLSYNYLNSYSKTKRIFGELAKSVYDNSQTKFINARLEHVFGPNDSLNKFTYNIIFQLLRNVTSIELTLGEQKRDFISVDDVSSAYRVLVNNLDSFYEGYIEVEVGRGTSISIRQFIESAHSLTNSTTKLLFGALPYRDSEIMDSCADISKMKELGWKWEDNVEDGITKIIKNLN